MGLRIAGTLSSFNFCLSSGSTLCFDPELDFSDFLDASLQPVAIRQLPHACRRAGGDEIARAQGQHAGQEADVVAQPADHVTGVRVHDGLAVLLDADLEVLRLVDLIARHDPGPQSRERVEALADVARVLTSAPPRIALAEVPADGIAEDVVERFGLGDLAGGLPDHRAQLALEIHVYRNLRQDYRAAGSDDGRSGLQEEFRP